MKQQSVEFAKKHQAVIYLVLSLEDAELLVYFSITIKPLVVRAEPFSNTVKRKLVRFSEIDKGEQTYNLAAYLIVQLGKNYNDRAIGRITGKELLEAAIRQIQYLQYQVGGMVAFEEAENKVKLLSFYENYGFKQFDTRQTVIFHKHQFSRPYHQHGRGNSLRQAIKSIQSHDRWQMNGRK